MSELMIDPAEHSASGSDRLTDLGEAVMRPAHVFAVPASQRYYWTDVWQAGERETLVALDQGHGIRFSSGREFADWLLSDNDDEPDAAAPDGD